MALQGSSAVIGLREGGKKLVIDNDDLDEVTFDRYNEETFSEMGASCCPRIENHSS